MRANDKERKCIDYTKTLIKKAVYSRLKKENHEVLKKISLKSLLESFGGEFIRKKNIFFRKMLLVTILTISHIIFSVFLIIVALFDSIFIYIKLLKVLKRLDYNTSNIKTFTELWYKKGISFMGHIQVYKVYNFSDSEQLECMSFWFKILYGKDELEFIELKELAKECIRETLRKLSNNNRIKIYPAKTYDVIKNTIDKRYASYLDI